MKLEIGDWVQDPETSIVYTYRPDINEESPFEYNGEWFDLAGVDYTKWPDE